MRVNQFDAHNKESITVEVVGPSYQQRIDGQGYFIIANPDSKFVCFSKVRHDLCFGDVTKDVIPEYTNQQYADEYGHRLTGMGSTMKEYLQRQCRMNIA